jgi:hypothetical protein
VLTDGYRRAEQSEATQDASVSLTWPGTVGPVRTSGAHEHFLVRYRTSARPDVSSHVTKPSRSRRRVVFDQPFGTSVPVLRHGRRHSVDDPDVRLAWPEPPLQHSVSSVPKSVSKHIQGSGQTQTVFSFASAKKATPQGKDTTVATRIRSLFAQSPHHGCTVI